VVTAETRLPPVLAYSSSARFSWEEDPRNALLWLLRTDLLLRRASLRDGVAAQAEIERNEARWAFYATAKGAARATDTWGPWITFSTWNQDAPYWNLCPMDPVTVTRCYVGCGGTALAQILNYWRYPSSVLFTGADDYTSTYDPGDGSPERVIPIDAASASIPSIAYGTGDPSDSVKAAISFAAGVSVEMDYSSVGSGSSCANIAASLAGGLPDWSWVVDERWGYDSADYRTTDLPWQPWPPFYATVEEIYALLQEDATPARPSIIVIRSDTSGHFVIVDGYRSTGEYHVNFGWGGYCDGWYVLPTGLPEGYNVVKQAVVNIAAPASPAGTAAVFRVDDAGVVSSDAGVFGSSFAAGAADVAEWVCTTEAVEAGDVLQLDPDEPGSYCETQGACSPLVAGVVSSAPGVILGWTDSVGGKTLLALSGIVPVKVTNEGGTIQPGDLLVSSSTPGYAMRWAGPEPCPCALVGKALEAMTGERGVISILLTAH
jgi:hypothetical protein